MLPAELYARHRKTLQDYPIPIDKNKTLLDEWSKKVGAIRLLSNRYLVPSSLAEQLTKEAGAGAGHDAKADSSAPSPSSNTREI